MTHRSITTHVVNPVNDKLLIDAIDQPGPGGANHRYIIHGFDTSTNTSCEAEPALTQVELVFQKGGIAEVGVNGITHEALLAVLIDRLEAFQAGPFANIYNARALSGLCYARDALAERTRERMSRGVEGTQKV